jgi:hypothetical protein
VGLDAARGEYLGFVDSDDAVTPAMYEHMYEQARAGDYDMVDGGIYYQGKDLAMVHTADEDTGEQDDEKRSHNIVSGGYLMSRIYRRSFWEDCGVRFREGVILEDMETLMYLQAKAARIGNLKEICYVYRDTAGSASKEVDYRSYQRQIQDAMRAVYERMSPLPCYPGIAAAVEYTILQLYAYALTNCLMQKGRLPEAQILQRQQELRTLKDTYTRQGCGNPYVQSKISRDEIRVMEMNDRDPLGLLRLINVNDGKEVQR